MLDPAGRKDCSRCGLEDAPFGRNRSRKDGLQPYCKMCMYEIKTEYAERHPVDWSQYNRQRRSRPGYREKEKKRANELDAKRRKEDRSYVLARSASNRKWRTSGDAQGKKDKANERKCKKYKERRAQMDPATLAKLRQNQIDGFRRFQATAIERSNSPDNRTLRLLVAFSAGDSWHRRMHWRCYSKPGRERIDYYSSN